MVLPFFPCFRLLLAWEHSVISRENQYVKSFFSTDFLSWKTTNICADVFEINCTYLSSFTSSPSHTTLSKWQHAIYIIITPAAMSKFMAFNREICPVKNWWAKGVLSDTSAWTSINCYWHSAVVISRCFTNLYYDVFPSCICLLAVFDHMEIICLSYVL